MLRCLCFIGILFAAGSLFYSCQYPCGRASSSIGLISFTDTESDIIILRRFSKSTNFTDLQDTFTISRNNSNFQREHDTLLILHGMEDGNNDITSSYDYEIFLPKISRLYRLSDIVEDIKYGSKLGPKIYCINPIISYKLNGQPVDVVNYYSFIYLKK